VIVAPIGGGGLISGLATGQHSPNTTLLGAEPALGNDAARSLKEGRIVQNQNEPMTIADGARTVSVGNLNWPIIQRNVPEIIEVSEENIVEAVRLYFGQANLKCEPTGALSLGAVLEKPEAFEDKKVCVIVSGGNVDASVYTSILSGKS
jgi:threonine dehydratase